MISETNAVVHTRLHRFNSKTGWNLQFYAYQARLYKILLTTWDSNNSMKLLFNTSKYLAIISKYALKNGLVEQRNVLVDKSYKIILHRYRQAYSFWKHNLSCF